MGIMPMRELLIEAKREKKAVTQININGYDWIEGVLKAAKELQKPVIIGVTDRNMERLGGYEHVVKLIHLVYGNLKMNTPVVIHLDHSLSVDHCKRAIDAGFTSVMFDGSNLSLEENIRRTKEVVDYAQPRQVTVEAELGSVGGVEDGMTTNLRFAEPNVCADFIFQTGIDALAAALGSVHGKYVDKPDLQFHLMKKINELTETPLVLHGASGLSEEDIHKAILLGHAKINFNTEINVAASSALRNKLEEDLELYDPKEFMTELQQAIINTVKEKIYQCQQK